jgi:DNA-damage-inducible protein D
MSARKVTDIISKLVISFDGQNSGYSIKDHFGDITEMVAIGSGAERPIKTTLMSRYACYLAIQNADPKKEIVAHGQTLRPFTKKKSNIYSTT